MAEVLYSARTIPRQGGTATRPVGVPGYPATCLPASLPPRYSLPSHAATYYRTTRPHDLRPGHAKYR
jgi:hypothetical protein